MPYLICYDITNNKKRLQISKLLQASGLVRIQKSVFLGSLSLNGKKALEVKLNKLLTKKQQPNDKIHIVSVNRNAILQMSMLGQGLDPRIVLGKDNVIVL